MIPPNDLPFLRLLSRSVEPLAVVDAQTLLILAATPALGHMFGQPPQALTGLAFSSLLAPHEQTGVTALLLAFTADGVLPPRRSYLFVRADNMPLPSDIRGLRFTLPSGRPVALMTLRPVQELLGSVSFYQQVLEELPLALTVQDAEGRYVYINPYALADPELRGRAIGLTVREVMAAEGRAESTALEREAQFRLAAQTRTRVEWQEQSTRPRGDIPRLTHRVAVPIFEEDGGPLSLMLCFARDITLTAWQAEQIQLLDSLIQATEDPMAILDVRPGPTYQQVIHANLVLRQLDDAPPDAHTRPFHSDPLAWVSGPRDRQAIRAALEQLRHHTTATRMEEVHLPDLDIWFEVSFTPVYLTPDQLTHWAVVLRDVTRRKRERAFLQEFMAATLLALRDAPLRVVVSQMLRGMEQILPSWTAVLILPEGEALQVYGDRLPAPLRDWLENRSADQLRDLWAQRDPQRLGRALTLQDPFGPHQQDAGAQTRTSVELALYDPQQTLLGVLALLHPSQTVLPTEATETLGASAGHIALVIERHHQRQQLQQLAYHDSLTGLLNRDGFSRDVSLALTGAARTGAPLALGVLDLNRFKTVNDSLGHAAGDRLLQAFARRLQAVGEKLSLHLLTRLGGDEFAFVLGDPNQMDEVDTTLSQMLAEPFALDGRSVHIGLALGWSVYPYMAADLDTLLQQADSAMYVAKRTGRPFGVYAPTTRPCISGFELESALQTAIQDGQLSLVYQPQVSVTERRIVGAEALLRWCHPQIGNIAPSEFIPLAESLGLMDRLGNWVIERACRDAARWTDPELTVSINVSVLQLQHPHFLAALEDAALRHGLGPQRLVIELTETVMISDVAGLHSTLEQLRSWGARIAVDDFGTGYSTLLSLRQFQADELKIDRSFIQDLGQPGKPGRDSRAIVEVTLTLAATFGLGVVAEGVETEQQAALLREMGCPVMQGWLIAPGLTQDEFLRRFGSAQPDSVQLQ
ncbi:sensor domain-containing protein [Deinococcus marmoris]|nr:EAL domain-containing protein [Deinococcus marmoris]